MQFSLGQVSPTSQAKKIFFDQKKHDTLRVDAAIQLADAIYSSDLDSAHVLIKQAHTWSSKHNYKKGLSITDGYFGYIYHTQGDLIKGIDFYQKSIAFNRKNNFNLNLAMDLGNYGALLDGLEDTTAIAFFQESIDIYKKHHRDDDIAHLYSYIGNNFSKRGHIDSAIHYFNLGLSHAKRLDTKATLKRHVSEVYVLKGNLSLALRFVNEATELTRESKSASGIKRNLISKLDICIKSNQFKDAEKCVVELEAMRDVKVNSKANLIFDQLLGRLASHRGDYEAAYFYLNSAYNQRDEIYNEELIDILKRKSIEFEYQQKSIRDSIKLSEEEQLRELKYETKLKAEATSRYILLGSIVSLLIIVGLITRSYFKNRRNTKIIEQQNSALGKKDKETTDSINYAKRIQSVILPSENAIKEAFPKSFIYNRPKNIIGGDFYWLFKKNNTHLLAVADCTGHGVPGALLSIICSEALNRAVGEFNLEDPAQILDKVRELIKDHLLDSNEKLTDGMDISLVGINKGTSEKDDYELCFAGANSFLLVKSPDSIDLLRGDKQPIGKYFNESSFKNVRVGLNKNDMVFLTTDGYLDQFGGPAGKKMKLRPFTNFLESINENSLSSYESAIVQHFEEWKGEEEQVDDVCFIGFQIS